MTASNFDIQNSVDTTDAADFVPEMWAIETLAAYKANLVLAGLVSLIPHIGKIGDVIRIPVPGRSDANSKTGSSAVTVIAYADSTHKTVTIDQHYHYAHNG